MTSKFELGGRKALITGGSRGIGHGIAGAMASAGADIVLVARDESALASAAAELACSGRSIQTYSFDMNDAEQISAFYRMVVDDAGPIDILVNNAGATRRGPAHELELADWQQVLGINLTSVFALCQAFARERIASGKGGKIINIASLMSESVRENNAPYAASKGGIRQLTKALAVEWAKHGINVNGIGPGYIRTDLTRVLWEDPQFDTWVKGRTPMARWGIPEDLGYAAVFLAAPASNFVTGQILYVDGGFLARF